MDKASVFWFFPIQKLWSVHLGYKSFHQEKIPPSWPPLLWSSNNLCRNRFHPRWKRGLTQEVPWRFHGRLQPFKQPKKSCKDWNLDTSVCIPKETNWSFRNTAVWPGNKILQCFAPFCWCWLLELWLLCNSCNANMISRPHICMAPWSCYIQTTTWLNRLKSWMNVKHLEFINLTSDFFMPLTTILIPHDLKPPSSSGGGAPASIVLGRFTEIGEGEITDLKKTQIWYLEGM